MSRRPSDGIIASQRPGGWLSRHWRASMKPLEMTHGPFVSRGRTLARGGRVRDLWFSPGLAGAEVVDRETFRVTLRFRTLEVDEWQQVRKALLSKLSSIAALMEGSVPRSLLSQLDEEGLRLLPSWRRTWGRGASLIRDVDADCDCDNAWRLPCAHAAAVYAVLADALDGDPFLLLTLRGRSRPQLLNELRVAWGDKQPLRRDDDEAEEEPPPTGNWYSSPQPLGQIPYSFADAETATAGLRALGPPPGGETDLHRALVPLYEAGARHALELVHDDPTVPPMTPTPAPIRRIKAPSPEKRFAEKLVDLLDALVSAKTNTLAEKLGVAPAAVRRELLELENAGLVTRKGRTRGTLWSVG